MRIFALLCLFVPASVFALSAPVAHYVKDAYAFASLQGDSVGVAFMEIHNNRDEAVALVSASSDVAEAVELHAHIHEDGVMKMRHIESISVPANGSVSLEPGGYHVMLIGLKTPLEDGHTFPLTLTLEERTTLQAMVKVRARGAKAKESHKHH